MFGPTPAWILPSVFLACLLSACTPPDTRSFIHDGQHRTYRLHLPPHADSQVPLVLVMHGYGGDGLGMESGMGWVQLANESGFAVCFPDGTVDSLGRRFWNVGYAMHAELDVDDSDFLVNLARHLQTEHHLDPGATFAAGFSNGADMSYLLGCTAPDVFPAIGPVAGTMMDSVYFQLKPDLPCSVIAFNGTDDAITRFRGDPDNIDGWGAYRSVPEVIDFWVKANHLTEFDQVTLGDSSTSEKPGVELDRYWAVGQPVAVNFYRITGGGHDWPLPTKTCPIDATRLIWDFFSSHRSEPE